MVLLMTKTKKKKVKKCPLDPIDWLNLFQNYKTQKITTSLSLSNLLLIVLLGIISVMYAADVTNIMLNNLDNLPIFLFASIIYFAALIVVVVAGFNVISILKGTNEKVKVAEIMIDKIINGETDTNKIREEWRLNFQIKNNYLFRS